MAPVNDVPPPPTGPDDPTALVVRRCRHCAAAIPAASAFCSKCGATAGVAAADPLRDRLQTLVGRELEIERELGRGGMAAVFAAFDPALQRRVAVKVLLPEIADDAAMADRFLREARTVAALQHPHVVTVHGVRSGDGMAALVMQFVEGRSLDVVLVERGRLPLAVAGLLLAQTAEGLQHAHDRGVVHRDVKPANVLIDRDGRAIVSDFGIARRDNAPRTTGTGMVVGTWAYMSPEQRSAQRVTPATDQYAFGVMAFEVLTGVLPFRGTAGEVMRAHLMDAPPPMRALRPDVPEPVEAVVRRMLAKDPADRWPSLRDAERAFRTLVPDAAQTTLQMASYAQVASAQVASARPVDRDAPTSIIAAVPAPTVPAVPAVPAGVAARPSRRPWAVAAVMALAALGGWAALRRGPAGPASSPVAAAAPVPATEGFAARAVGSSDVASAAPSAAPMRGDDPRPPVSRESVVPSGKVTPSPLAGANPGANAGTTAGAAPPAASAEPSPAAPSPVVRDPEPAAARTMPAFAVADARRLGREFVTLLNQRRARDLAQYAALGGDAGMRADLLRLTESAPDFAAGFDRVPSAPDEWTKGFQTEFHLDLEWRGGRTVMRVRLFASPADGGWRTVAFAVDQP